MDEEIRDKVRSMLKGALGTWELELTAGAGFVGGERAVRGFVEHVVEELELMVEELA